MKRSVGPMKLEPWTVVGLLVSALLPATYGTLMTRITPDPLPQLNLGLIPIFYSFALLSCVVLGLPAYVLGLRFNLVRWRSALIAGTFIGAITALIIRSGNQLPGDFLVLCPLGAATAFVFWLIVTLGKNRNLQS